MRTNITSHSHQIIPILPDGPGNEGLAPWSPPAQDRLAPDSPTPVTTGYRAYVDSSGRLSAGVWTCSGMRTRLNPYRITELIHLISGRIIYQYRDGSISDMRAGDTFIVPKGAEVVWSIPEPTKKIFCAFDDRAPLTQGQDSRVIERLLDGVYGRVFHHSTEPYGVWVTSDQNLRNGDDSPISKESTAFVLAAESAASIGASRSESAPWATRKSEIAGSSTFEVPKGNAFVVSCLGSLPAIHSEGRLISVILGSS